MLTAADGTTAIAVDMPGQAHEAAQAESFLDQAAARVPDPGEVVVDKDFNGDLQRQAYRAAPTPPQQQSSVTPRSNTLRRHM